MDLLRTFQKLGCFTSVKHHFLHSHLEYFLENLEDFSEEHYERFHQNIRANVIKVNGTLPS